jgi:LacI family transcriptional regulator
MEAAQEMGLDVPGDVSVIGFDDIPEAARTTPALSTVRQPIQQMGSAAVELLIALMDGCLPEKTHVRLPTSLVLRGTTALPADRLNQNHLAGLTEPCLCYRATRFTVRVYR